jgi:hypothetical protein
MKLVTTLQSFIPSQFEYMFVFMLGSIIYVIYIYIYIYICFVWFSLKQVINEACNNTKKLNLQII